MRRPEFNTTLNSGYEAWTAYAIDLEHYSTILEETIVALKDSHAELLRNYTDCVKSNKTLQKYSNFLSALESCGVDNWEGYDDAVELYQKEYV